MRLSWHEIRARAAIFATGWAGEGYEKGQAQHFYRDFFDVFGMPVRRLAAFEEPVQSLGQQRGYVDLFWKGVLLVEQKSVGRSLRKARTQALEYFPHLKDAELPRYLLLSDFQSFELHDLDEGAEVAFRLAELPDFVEHFGFVLGVQKRSFHDQDPVNIEASELVRELYDRLSEANPDGGELDRYLVRLVFCFFADDTGIFEPRDAFADLIDHRTLEDGADLGRCIAEVFQVLNTPDDQRSAALDPDLAGFPYIDGDLFKERLLIHSFDSAMRERLLDACRLDWSRISPAVFGALFLSVMDPAERRAQGAHYTTEKNILKVIEPLFLDELRSEFSRLKARRDSRKRADLEAFHRRLGAIRCFDPACGCGNFLVIAYRELRMLEIEVIRELRAYQAAEGQQVMDAPALSQVDVDQFYGIELGAIPVRIAETALWMMDHLMNSRLNLEFGQTHVRIPLRVSSRIVRADALETDWADVLPPDRCSYVLGNPPFGGAKLQSETQREQVRRIAELGSNGGTLDYVAAWFLRAGEYARRGGARIGFVATNSIMQGEQVGQLWPKILCGSELVIAFAHRTFVWGSDTRVKAHVHVVVIGLESTTAARKDRRLFSYSDLQGEPVESRHASLSPYLMDASGLPDPRVVVRESSQQLSGLPPMVTGSQPIDDGNFIFDAQQRAEFLAQEPCAERFLRPYIGSREHLHRSNRWILALQEATPSEIRAMPEVVSRLRAVREYRRQSKRTSTLAIAEYPANYNVEVLPTAPFLVVPQVTSERRQYVPIGWAHPPVIPSSLVCLIEDASNQLFGLLTSAMHMTWLRHVGGRLKSDYRYSIGLVYNTFPAPPCGGKGLTSLELPARAVLDARAERANATLADIYDPSSMPTKLRSAHRDLDRAVDRLYRKKPFGSDRERFQHLLAIYGKCVALIPASIPKSGRKRLTSAKRVRSGGIDH